MKFDFHVLRPGVGATVVLAGLAAIVIGCGGGGGGGMGTSATTATTATTTNTASTTATAGNSATTSTATTATTGATTSGVLPVNEIYFTQLSASAAQSYDVRVVKPDGTSDTQVAAGIPNGVAAFTLNPATGTAFFPVLSGSSYGIASGSLSNTLGGTTIVGAQYAQITSMVLSPDGNKLVFTASTSLSNPYNLYVVSSTGGTPTLLDAGVAGSATVNLNGDVAYDKDGGSGIQIFKTSVAGGIPVALTSGNPSLRPRFSRDGSKLVYIKDDGTGRYDLGVINLNGTGQTVLTLPSNFSAKAPTFNGDGTQIAFVDVGSDGTKWGLYRIDTSGSSLAAVKVSSQVKTFGTYWTTLTGRGHSDVQLSFSAKQ